MKAILFTLFSLTFFAHANADEILAQTKFAIRNNRKEFSVQHLNSRDLTIVHMGLTWANFNQSIHSNGFKIGEAQSLNFISPALPDGCQLADSTMTNKSFGGFLNGIDAGSNLLQFVLRGKSCEAFAQALRQTNFEVIFNNVPAMQTGAAMTAHLRLEVLEIP